MTTPSASSNACATSPGTPVNRLSAFARAHGIPDALLPKLRALKEGPALRVDAAHVRPFFRYAGARHRGSLPPEARAFCYLDRRLIPRGDHRLRGPYDPHLGAVKLLFNVRELPLSAALLEEEGCVHDHRHARFAPLLVPQRVRDEGLSVTRTVALPGGTGAARPQPLPPRARLGRAARRPAPRLPRARPLPQRPRGAGALGARLRRLARRPRAAPRR